MRSTRRSGLVLAGVVGLAGLGVGATIGPVAASAATSSTTAVGDRVTAITKALAGLVSDGTITQSQADKVASTLSTALPQPPGPGGWGPGRGHGPGRGAELDAAATIIGVTPEQLRTDLQAGKTLAQIAQGRGISQSTLVDKLVAAEKTRIAADVEAGRLTQAQADTIISGLTDRVTKQVTSTRPVGPGGPGGPGGPHGHGPWGEKGTAPAPSGTTAPSAPATPTPSPSGTPT
ncbi:hypothetical protein EV189_1674 [Motilibacter rhizosphaerae]|uniref:Uncharacterized protein n=1 Tax=Motilibacter rhizosphaerae TaxID=598652 RepID=A0A4Q7NSA5_9ACTN|nr:hypothetical protein [Motilibacter rhizosphaerae]RZS89895.1 hypothetical protein EV189_1674 [Motilibacter rhizosphaerae]